MLIKREIYLKKIRTFYEIDLIKVLTGVRRCGKSVLLNQIADEILEKGIADSHIIKINFEDLQFEKIRTYEKLDKFIHSKIKDSEKYYVFLDEYCGFSIREKEYYFNLVPQIINLLIWKNRKEERSCVS